MIEWHKVTDELPPYDTPVLVSGSDTRTYLEEYVHVMKIFIKNHTYLWQCMWDADVYEVYEDDYWAYINLPKKDGDSD